MFFHRWHVDPELSKKVHESLRRLYKNLKNDDIIPEADMIAAFLEHLKDVSEEYKNEEVLKRWLSMTKGISKNPLGEWGLAASPNIRAKGKCRCEQNSKRLTIPPKLEQTDLLK